LGLKNAEDLKVRSDLLSHLAEMIKTSELSQKEIAEILGISQSKVSMLVSGKLSAFSADTLLQYLRTLGCNIDIQVQSRIPLVKSVRSGRMTVHRNKAHFPRGERRTPRRRAFDRRSAWGKGHMFVE